MRYITETKDGYRQRPAEYSRDVTRPVGEVIDVDVLQNIVGRQLKHLRRSQHWVGRLLKTYKHRTGKYSRRIVSTAALILMVTGIAIALMSNVAQAAISLRSSSSAFAGNQPVKHGQSVGDNGGGTGSLIIAMPAGTVEGDTMFAVITVRGGSGVTITAPGTGGWTQIGTQVNSTTALAQSIFWRRAVAGESGSYTWTFAANKATGAIISYSNADPTNPVDVSAGNFNASNTAITAPAVTPTVDNEILIGFFGTATGTTLSCATMTLQTQTLSGGGGAAGTKATTGICTATLGAGTAGVSTGTKAATAAAAAVNIGHLLAIKTVSTTSLPLNKPTGVVQNDVMIAAITLGGNTTLTGPSAGGFTWNFIREDHTTGTASRTELWWRAAGASDPSSYTWTWTGSHNVAGVIIAYSGVDTTSPVEANNATVNNTSSNTFTAPSVTTANLDQLVSIFSTPNIDAPASNSPLTQEVSAVALGTGFSEAIGLGDQALSAIGATGTRTATVVNAGPSISQTLALLPAVATLSQGSNRWFDEGQVAGQNWTSRLSAVDNNWQSVTYGNGLFVAISNTGTGNLVMTSSDGITWTSRTSASNDLWTSVTYGNGMFVAVSQTTPSNLVMTSPDGVTWNTHPSAANNSWKSVTYGNGMFVAVANGASVVMTSSDGSTWATQTAPVSLNWNSVTYGNGLFVAVSSSGTGNRVMTSPDGVIWTSRNAATDIGWNSVTYGNGLFVAVAGNGTNRVMTSPDGVTWTTRIPAIDNVWNSVTYGNGLFVAVSDNIVGAITNRVMTSPDGVTWTSRTAAADNVWHSVTYGNGMFVAVSSSGTGNRVMTSTALQATAATWTSRSGGAFNGNTWTSVTYGNGLFVASGIDGFGHDIATSPDGINWTARSTPGTFGWRSVTYGNGKFVAVANSGSSNEVMTSSDGITWATQSVSLGNGWLSVTYGNGFFVAVGGVLTGHRAMWSSDGNAWTLGNTPVDDTWESVTYGNGLFVAVAADGTVTQQVMTSPDGATWTSHGASAANWWDSVTYGNGMFVAVAQTGTGNRVMTSPDGSTWTSRTSAADYVWQSVTYGNGLFVAVAGSGTGNRVMTSPDGINWTSRTSAADNNWNAVAYGNGMYAAVSSFAAGSSMMTAPAVDASVGTPLAIAQNTASVAINSDNVRLRMNLDVSVNPWTAGNISQKKLALQYATRTGTCNGSETYYDVGTAAWTSRSSAADNIWNSVTYGNGVYVAVSSSGTNRVMRSVDGTNWTNPTTPAVSTGWYGVAYGKGLFVAVGFGGVGASDSVMTSSDGITWNLRSITNVGDWDAITFANNTFVAVATSGGSVFTMSSSDGINWTSHSATANSYSSVTYGKGLFVAVSTAGTIITSSDGTSWTARTSPNSNQWSSIAYGNGLFVAVSASGTGNDLMWSYDGINWKAGNGSTVGGWTSVTYGNGLFVVLTSGSTGMISFDGLNWKNFNAASTNSWSSSFFGNGQFVAVSTTGTGNRVMTMTPPVNWGGQTANNYGTVTDSGNDPTASGAVRKQFYITNNYFTNQIDTATSESGQFDFDLDLSNAAYNSSYCFRVVTYDGTALSAYTSYPLITRCVGAPPLQSRTRYGQAICGGGKRFYWGRSTT